MAPPLPFENYLFSRDQTPGIAFLSGFSSKKRTTAITKAAAPRMAKNVECSHLSQYTPIIVSLLPTAVATNQPPIIRPRILIGATFDTSASPIGESINSPNVTTPYEKMSHIGDTLKAYGSLPVTLASPIFAAKYRTKKESPVSVIPIAILVGVEGSLPLLSSHFQNHTSGKVKETTHIGLIAFERVPVTFHSVFLSAQ